jgi:two-component system nitrogen regulation sensor histidine kinase NtrY
VVVLTSDTDDRVRALVRLDGFGDAYLFVGRFVDATVLGYMERTQSVVAEYQRLESGRSDIQIKSALLFIVVALLLLLAAVWIGLNFANGLVAPLSQLITAADRVRGGDFQARVPEEGPDEDELAALSRAFNRMTAQLASQRHELVQANQELDQRGRFTETVLAGVSAGVIGLDAGRRVLLHNRSAAQLLGGHGDKVAGCRIEALVPGVEAMFDRLGARPPGETVEQELRFVRRGGERVLLVRLAPQLDGEGGEGPGGRATAGYVVTFDDITALISAQRQAAWAEVAKRIAHEVKNPLTPIRLSAERLSRKYAAQLGDEREPFQKIVETIIRQVDTIGRLISEFSAFARMPAAVLKPERMQPLIEEAVLLQHAAWPRVRFEQELPQAPVEVLCDGPKVSQALTNLLQNAAQAMTEGGSPEGWWRSGCGGRRRPPWPWRWRTRGRASPPTGSGCWSPTSPPGPRDRLGACHRAEDHGGTWRNGGAALGGARRGARPPDLPRPSRLNRPPARTLDTTARARARDLSHRDLLRSA